MPPVPESSLLSREATTFPTRGVKFFSSRLLGLALFSVKMRLISLVTYLLYTFRIAVEAIPTTNNNQELASLKIAQWEKHYHHLVDATVKARTSGCTSDNIVYRQEW